MLGAASLNIFSSPPPVPSNRNNAINRIPSLPVTPFRKRVGKEEENSGKQGSKEEEEAGQGGNGKGKGKQVFKHKGWYATKLGEERGVTIGEDGVAYKVEGAPFEFKFSYTETPRVEPLALREPPYVPFARQDFARPWTGRAPLSKSKKMLPKLRSSRPAEPLSPFLMVNGPNYRAPTREEILGEPLTREEKHQLLFKSMHCTRQVNLGRDGLTHNMLELIHTHWKRQQVCKIKCKGVPTVDMKNVYRNLEEKTGGKIIYRIGGVVHLFRGRNYNYKSRPRFPLMLWKPATPVYPKLIVRAPEGLTGEEADALRKKARHLPAICKLGKNGVYHNLVKHIRNAFEETELVRINCRGMQPSDYRKIAGKLKELVPCVLLSFDKDHILMWRGKEYKVKNPRKSDLDPPAYGSEYVSDDSTNSKVVDVLIPDQIVCTNLGESTNLNKELVKQSVSSSKDAALEDEMYTGKCRGPLKDESYKLHISRQPADSMVLVENDRYSIDDSKDETDVMVKASSGLVNASKRSELVHDSGRECQSNATHVTDYADGNLSTDDTTVTVNSSEILSQSHFPSTGVGMFNTKCMETAGNDSLDLLKPASPKLDDMHVIDNVSEDRDTKEKASLATKEVNGFSETESIESLWQQAIESRLALLFDGPGLDPNAIVEKYVNSAQTAPPGPDIKCKHTLSAKKDRRHRKESAKDERDRSEGKKTSQHINSKQVEEIVPLSDKVPLGMLPVDDLAKLLLAP